MQHLLSDLKFFATKSELAMAMAICQRWRGNGRRLVRLMRLFECPSYPLNIFLYGVTCHDPLILKATILY